MLDKSINHKGMNPQRRKFAKEYVKSGNATQAAIKAGYSEKSAAAQGSQLLNNPSVKREMARILDLAGLSDEELARDLKTAIKKGIESDKVTVSDGLKGIRMAMELKDKFPAKRHEIQEKSLKMTLEGKSMDELEEQYNRLLGEMKEYHEQE